MEEEYLIKFSKPSIFFCLKLSWNVFGFLFNRFNSDLKVRISFVAFSRAVLSSNLTWDECVGEQDEVVSQHEE